MCDKCCCCKNDENDKTESHTKAAEDMMENRGPCQKRHFTNPEWLCIYAGSWVVFMIVTLAGFSNGDPGKLYKPRDFKGDYCGVETNWNGGRNLQDHEWLIYMMNVTSSVDKYAKTLVCSTAARQAIDNNNLLVGSDYDDYLCACCYSPCASCYGATSLPDYDTTATLNTATRQQMSDLTSSSAGIYSQAGGRFNNIMTESALYLSQICVSGCDAFSGSTTRTYDYMPSPDSDWYTAWWALKTYAGNQAEVVAIQNIMQNAFRFNALDLSVCPYPAKYCVPFPGLEFEELEMNYCGFKANAAMVAALGDAVSSIGTTEVGDWASEGLGEAFGDLMSTLDVLAIVAVLSFVIGLVFLILLRFFVGIVTWLAIFLVFIILLLGGTLCYLRHVQCKGDGLFTVTETASAAVTNTVSATVNGVSINNEAMTGNGMDYRGQQSRTRTGRTCQHWDCYHANQTQANVGAQCVNVNSQYIPSSSLYSGSDLQDNLCRNPSGVAPTIWCFTTDSNMRWETCLPLTTIVPSCPSGYEVENETARKLLEISAFVIWGLALLWALLICCFCKRIRLAIALNKVAAQFIVANPLIVVIPLIQIVVAIIWCFIWALCACFLLSQVPDGYTPSDSYTTFAEAYGTDSDPGKCTDKWPTGIVWKDEGDITSSNDPCSGNLGDITGIIPRCFRCAPPRYVFDVRFAISFFQYLWTNALFIALGQCIIAGAVAVWFFTPRSVKGSKPCIRTSTKNAIVYHLGSLAFGAFIIAVVQFIRYTLKYFEKQAQAQKNKIMEIVFKIVGCLVWCFEKCIRFLNKNAYIQIAINGTAFCVSAKNAFWMIFSNMLRFGLLAVLSSVIRRIGFLFIMAATTVTGYFVLKAMHPDVSPVIPILTYIALSYVVSMLYMNVFAMAADTSLQCFIATEQMGGDVDFVPAGLQNLVDKQETTDASKGAWT